jgi:hypothetical protein
MTALILSMYQAGMRNYSALEVDTQTPAPPIMFYVMPMCEFELELSLRHPPTDFCI